MNFQVQGYLSRFVDLFTEEMREQLVGIYLHGSLAMGCFNPLRSDIDLIVVIKEKNTDTHYKHIVQQILSLHDDMTYGLEFTMILESTLQSFEYPTPAELHYSDYHREKYRVDDQYLCSHYEDADLAAQLAVAYYRGITLYGQPMKDLYPPISRQYYLASIHYDIRQANKEIIDNAMYITLNLCRVLYYIREGTISSKREGGEWGVKNVPLKYRDIVEFYLNEYNGVKVEAEIAPTLLTDFAEYMVKEIEINIL